MIYMYIGPVQFEISGLEGPADTPILKVRASCVFDGCGAEFSAFELDVDSTPDDMLMMLVDEAGEIGQRVAEAHLEEAHGMRRVNLENMR